MHACSACAGVYSNGYDASLNVKNGFPVFTTVIEANFINRQEDRFAAFKLSDEDKQEILKLARDPRIGAAFTALRTLSTDACPWVTRARRSPA